jgi:hypothetical protein
MDRFVTVVVCLIACACSTPAEPTFDRRLRLVSSSMPGAVAAGETFAIDLRLVVVENCIGTQPKLVVHAGDTHIDRVLGTTPAMMWHVGDVIDQTVTVAVPSTQQGGRIDVDVGVSEDSWRWPVAGTDTRIDDAKRTVRIGGLDVSGIQAETVIVPRVDVAPIIDGSSDDVAWTHAATLGPFVATDLAAPITRATTTKMVWQDSRVFVLFTMNDPDPHSPYVAHDDPLYESEAWEMFIDADADGDDYSELQANIRDVTFDASFSGGARKNMNWGFSPSWTLKTTHDRATQTVTSEWSIDATTLVDVESDLAGTSWRINLFRLERLRAPTGAVTSTEASAWRAPLARDFHTLSRFGVVRFAQ